MANYATSNIRTVALVGQGASGKTTLAEALLLKAGAIKEAGTVERGTTVSDFDPMEKTYQHSLRASVLPPPAILPAPSASPDDRERGHSVADSRQR